MYSPEQYSLPHLFQDAKNLTAVRNWFEKKENRSTLPLHQRILSRQLMRDIDSGKLGVLFCMEGLRLSDHLNDGKGGFSDAGYPPNFFENATYSDEVTKHHTARTVQHVVCVAVPQQQSMSAKNKTSIMAQVLASLYQANVYPGLQHGNTMRIGDTHPPEGTIETSNDRYDELMPELTGKRQRMAAPRLRHG